MKCKKCKTELVKEIKENIIYEIDDFNLRKILYKQEILLCSSCNYKFINSDKKQALKKLRKIPWVDRSIYE